jgi:hypothetical protein
MMMMMMFVDDDDFSWLDRPTQTGHFRKRLFLDWLVFDLDQPPNKMTVETSTSSSNIMAEQNKSI